MKNFFDIFFNEFSKISSEIFSNIIEFLANLVTTLMGLPGAYISKWMIAQGFSVEVPENVFLILDQLTYGVGYIVPLYGLLPIVGFWITFYSAKIMFSLFSTITRALSLGMVKI